VHQECHATTWARLAGNTSVLLKRTEARGDAGRRDSGATCGVPRPQVDIGAWDTDRHAKTDSAGLVGHESQNL
jgi:hypothetical protein